MSKKRFTIIARTYDKRGKQISIGINDYKKSHPMQKHFACLVGLPEKDRIHAEIQALLRCKDVVPYKITVERYNSEGTPVLAKPCPICQRAIETYGASVVEYTTSNGFVKEVI